MSAMTLKEVTRRFVTGNRSFPAVDNVSLTVRRGQRLALVGPSGSGKTTLLNLMGALDRPDGGTVQCLGVELSTASERKAADFRRKHLGFVFQQDALVPELTVHENVELPLVLLREDAAMRRETVDELLKALGLSQNARAYPGALSAGEKQRVAVARAVVHSPGILLADEPTANLDGISAGWVLDTIESLARKKDLTVILATHDARIFGRFESTIRLEDGRIVESHV
ncbi:MAG TPA: ABC transporter ATP-binding protein [Candidatus Hydrogenedentes bacterium]|jgi:putative ABC transport system ATP-binding protein|nr:ABC transporter ATP-binding protein [Candidatus Hydrogenedentota bacterium]MDY0030302.1 ABC transporter ATP-binding protein [FCB group bacterium]NLT61842.1 ABC transporter ATP-binding protein [Candidatus Hydrogenedentota bacterium]HNZ20246.1 ABC transporter ATP-binding protein [Candidatus Hydrogenedentota bacterium]HOH33486.1 ABC transporter ATP-binding protein [Candidatus Hydrogenedentota bacterium]